MEVTYISDGESIEKVSQIACCNCGTLTHPNDCNMCLPCIQSKVDITETIPRQAEVYFCRGCARYLSPPKQWIACELESKELLSICLKRLKELNSVELIDASFIWTEPHSKRIKLKLIIQKAVYSSMIIKQTFDVDFVIIHEFCDKCHRTAAKDTWNAVVQLRQKTSNKKTFFYLEQLILKYKAQTNCLKLKQHEHGIDYFYNKRDHAVKFVNFIQSHINSKLRMSQKLVSQDIKSNTQNFKYTFSVEMTPICKDDIVCLPPNIAQNIGQKNQLVICLNISSMIQLIDPQTARISELNCDKYWNSPFNSLASTKIMKLFTVIDVDIMRDHSHQNAPNKFVMADVWVEPIGDVGNNDAQIHCRTHLGHLLQCGDSVLGFDFRTCNINDVNLDKMKQNKVPDVILVKKVYPDRQDRHKRRRWKLQRLANEAGRESKEEANDFISFMEDLEEDPIMRQKVNIFVDEDKKVDESNEPLTEEYPEIALDEMLKNLTVFDEDEVNEQ